MAVRSANNEGSEVDVENRIILQMVSVDYVTTVWVGGPTQYISLYINIIEYGHCMMDITVSI